MATAPWTDNIIGTEVADTLGIDYHNVFRVDDTLHADGVTDEELAAAIASST